MLVVHHDIEAVLGQVVGLRPDLALVGALARLQLAALRLGCSIRLRDPCPELRDLLDLVGLAELVAGGAAPTARGAAGGRRRGTARDRGSGAARRSVRLRPRRCGR